MVWIWIMFLSCAFHSPEVGEENHTQRFRVEIQSKIGALLADNGGPPLQEAADLLLNLELSVRAVRMFRDGSVGKRVQFDSATLSHNGSSWDGLDLTGRAVELRTFPDGEILTIGWVDRIAGSDRFMDVFEVVFPAISPAPPSMKRNQEVKRRIIWPFLGEQRLRWDSAVDAVWKNEGLDDRLGEKAWRIAYEGPWRIHGGRRRGVDPIQFKAVGRAQGTTWFDRTTGDLVEHTFEWSRDITVKGEGGLIEQTQEFRGTVEGLR